MTKVIPYLVGFLLVAIAVACGDGGGAPGQPQEDAVSMLRQAHTAMSSLDSFQAVVTAEGVGDQFYFTVEWQRPDSFHLVVPWQGQTDDAEGEKGVGETIVIGDRSYGRQCKAEGRDCGDWTEAERGDIDFPAPSPGFDPRWPIVALGLTVYGQITGQQEVDGVPCIRVAGTVNILRAIYQALEEGLRQRGATTYGRECTARPGQPEECRDVPIEEFMEGQAEDIRRGDENPAPVDVWIGRDDKLLRRFATGPLPDGPEQAATTVLTYSRFNQVEIRPPE